MAAGSGPIHEQGTGKVRTEERRGGRRSVTLEMTHRMRDKIRQRFQTKAPPGYYITDTYRRRECSKFVPLSEHLIDRCKCGHGREEHSMDALEDTWGPEEEWNYQTDTIAIRPTDAYGEINFMTAENDILPLYLRCDIETRISSLTDLLLNKWSLPFPNLLISVFGGHSKFDSALMAAEMEIKKGLVKAAKSTKAWLFTSGVNHGVSNMVGDAVAMKRSFTSSIPVIGVNSWGAISNNWQLVEQDGLFPAHYHSVSLRQLERDPETGKPLHMALEHEHTHFILLDGGTRNNFHENQVRRFRIELQEALTHVTGAQLVSVLVEGGSGSLEEALLRLEAGLPLVILSDSGRIADVLCLAHELGQLGNTVDVHGAVRVRTLNGEEDRQRVMVELAKALPGRRQEQYDRFLDMIDQILHHDDLVTIWRPGKGEDLDKAILKGLIRSLTVKVTSNFSDTVDYCVKRSSMMEREVEERRAMGKELLKKQLQLTIQWQRLDIAEEYIFTNMTLEESELNDLLGLAIEHKQIPFIRNIIGRNANIKTFLTEERFESMLRSTPKSTLLYSLLLEQCKNPDFFMYEHFAQVVYKISEGVIRAPAKRDPSTHLLTAPPPSGTTLLDPFISIKICGARGKALNGATSYCHIDTEELHPSHNHRPSTTSSTDPTCPPHHFADPENVLALYLCLVHEQEMARVFWEYSRTPLYLGLVCSYVNKWMGEQEKLRIEVTDALSDQMEGWSAEWEGLAVSILDEVARYPEPHVRALIRHRYAEWGELGVLEMADYSEAVEVIAHNAVQEYVDTEWMGWLDPDISVPRILLGIFLPFLASFRDARPDESARLRKPTEASTDDSPKTLRRKAFVARGVSCEGGGGEVAAMQLPLLTRCWYFYKAPITKFYIYMIVYCAFLAGYAIALLIKAKLNSCGDSSVENSFRLRQIFNCKLTLAETFVYLWVLALIPTEIRQIYFSYPTTLWGKWRMYISNTYNKNDVACMLLILTAFICKMQSPSPENRRPPKEPVKSGGEMDIPWMENWFRLLFSAAFVLYCMRVCQALQIDKQLGPKVMMMHKMLLDLMFFINLVAIFVIGYGVSTTAIMNPNKYDSISFDLVFSIIWRPYVNLFGEIGEEDLMAKMNKNYCIFFYNDTAFCEDYSCGDQPGNGVCGFNEYVVRIFLAVYMMLAAVLMLNLLVAVFSSTYSNIEARSATMWKRQKFDLMNEFQSRSPLPVPLSTFLHVYRFFALLCRTCICCCSGRASAPTRTGGEDEHERIKISLLETECRRNFLDRRQQVTSEEVLESSVKGLVSEVGQVTKRLRSLESSIQGVLDTSVAGLKSGGRNSRGRSVLVTRPSTTDRTEYGIDELEEELYLEEEEVPEVTEALAAIDMAVSDSPGTPPIPPSPALLPVDSVRLVAAGKLCRTPEYPAAGGGVQRAFVKREHYDWDHPLLVYAPVGWSDPGLPAERRAVAWNERSEEGDDRVSYEGVYLVRNGAPLNPAGRTGLSGRGVLPRLGPNHVSVPIITRPAGDGLMEVLMDTRTDNPPEFFTQRDVAICDEIRDVFNAEAIDSDSELPPEKVIRKLNKIFDQGILVYRGLLDSERNTDNSWLEALVCSYHDHTGRVLRSFHFAGEDSRYRWRRVETWGSVGPTYRDVMQRAFYARNGCHGGLRRPPPNSPLNNVGY